MACSFLRLQLNDVTMIKPILAILLALIITNYLPAQSHLTIEQCEELFQKNNLLLIAEQYNIDKAEAAVIQASIWDQPVVSGEFNAVNPQGNKYFDAGTNGQKALAIQQLIYLGGKKKNEVAFAKSNVAIASLQFQQLLKSLRYQIRQNFYSIYFDGLKIKALGTQLTNLDTLTEAYAVQAKKGNVPLKDVVRLQSLSLSLKNELTEVQKNIFAGQENLKILTNMPDVVIPLATEKELNDFYYKPIIANIAELQQKALTTNPEYLTTQKITASNELLLKWQQSLAVPDVTVGANYDQRGGAFNNQVNFTFGIPLPFWNRNKGNIKYAEKQIAQSKTLEQQQALELTAAIGTAYASLQYQQKQYLQISNSTSQNLETVYNGVLQNFQKRNISLIEFTDFMESYNQSTLLLNEIKKQLLIARETLNYLVNENIF